MKKCGQASNAQLGAQGDNDGQVEVEEEKKAPSMIDTGASNNVVQAAGESEDKSEDSSDECGHDNKY